MKRLSPLRKRRSGSRARSSSHSRACGSRCRPGMDLMPARFSAVSVRLRMLLQRPRLTPAAAAVTLANLRRRCRGSAGTEPGSAPSTRQTVRRAEHISPRRRRSSPRSPPRSEEHTSELQSHVKLVCRLLLEKKKKHQYIIMFYIKKKTKKIDNY